MEYITKYQQFGSFLREFEQSRDLGFDLETTGLDWIKDDILLMQVKTENEVFVFDWQKLGEKYTTYLVDLLQSSGKRLIGHNLVFDIKFIKQKTNIWLTKLYDTMIVENIISNGTSYDRYTTLKSLVEKYLNIKLNKEVRDSFIGSYDITEDKIIYAAEDVMYLRTIMQMQLEIVKQQKHERVVWEIELPLIPVTASMEYNGVILNTEKWLNNIEIAKTKLVVLEQELKDEIFNRIDFGRCTTIQSVYDLLRVPYKETKINLKLINEPFIKEFHLDNIKNEFNINSNQQIKCALNLLGFEVENTIEDTLNELNTDDVIISKLLDYRGNQKLISTYGEKFLKLIHPVSGKIHTTFNQTVPQSGRYSSSNPNLQNLPADDNYRNCFIATPGFKIIGVDYGQQEYRLAGAISKEPTIITAYQAGKDMHTATAALVNGIKMEEVTKPQRTHAKTVNFSILYGTSAYGMAKKQGIKKKEAQRIIDLFFGGYPVLAEFMARVKEKIIELGYSSTLCGRKRYFVSKPLYSSDKEKEREIASHQREGFNHCVDYETLCLTRDGWLSGKNLAVGTEILTKNPITGDLEWNSVKSITKNILPTIEFCHRSFSAVTSLEHRWLVDTKSGRKSVFKTTASLSKYGDDRIHRTGNWIGRRNTMWSDNELKILGLVITDGYYHGKNSVRITQTKSGVSLMIDNLLRGVDYHKRTSDAGQNFWDLHVSDLTKKIRSSFPLKTLTIDFLFSLSKNQATILFDWMMLGDGSITGRSKVFWAGSKERAEAFQILSYLVGNSSKIHYSPPRISHPKNALMNSPKGSGCYFVTIYSNKRAQVTKNQFKSGGIRDVWCPTVKNGTFVANRSGYIYVTGNCTQGTGGDILKMALCRLFYENPFGEDRYRLLINVHDEIVSEARDDIVEQAKEFQERIMLEVERPFLGEIPAVVEGYFAPYWKKG